MSKSKRRKQTRPSFQQRYTRWNQNPRVQFVAAIASALAGIIWIVTGIVRPSGTSGQGGAVLLGLLFLGWGAWCLSLALRTFRVQRPSRKTEPQQVPLRRMK